MSFQTGLSGLIASSRSLDVIGNNIANANTTGMKSSRAEFSAMYTSMLGYGSGSNNGIGVQVANVAQQFTAGSISATGNNLDVAINGSGFFQLTQPDGSAAYTRDGSFKLDNAGYLKTNSGANLMGYPTDVKGVTSSMILQPIQLPTGAPIAAQATTKITAELNLKASAPIAANQVPVTPITTYGTSLTTYDSQGVEQQASLYFSKIDPKSTGFGVPAATTTLYQAWKTAVQAIPQVQATIDAAKIALDAAPKATTDQWAIYDSSAPITSAPGIWPTTPAAIGIMEFDATGKLITSYGAPAAVGAGNSVAKIAASVAAADAANTATPTTATATALATAISAATAAVNAAKPAFTSDATTTTAISTYLALATPTAADVATVAAAIATGEAAIAAATPYTQSAVTGDLSLTLTPNPSTSIVPPFDVTLSLGTVTEFGTPFSVSNLTQDGYTAGDLTGISIGENGVISAKYSNGQTQAAGQLALADFRNEQGLTPVGGNAWVATVASGAPISGSPNTGKFGALRAGALEDSNVDLTAELVNMMTAQRAYQANAQTIKTQDQIMSTLVNLR